MRTLNQQKELKKKQLTIRILEQNVNRELLLIRHVKEQTSMYRHDLRQHLRIISSYVENNNIELLKEYLAEYTQSLNLDFNITYCDNDVANTIISYYASVAHDKGIDFQSSLEIPSDIAIKAVDIYVLIGNLLENAVENCLISPNKPAKIFMRCKFATPNTFIITVDNYPTLKANKVKDKFTSTKHSDFGIGTISITTIAEKYNGNVDYHWSDEIFYASVLLTIL